MNRRRLVILLVMVGLGLPLLIEGWTLVEMLKKPFLEPDHSPASTARENGGVRVGDVFLESPPLSVTLTRALIQDSPGRWLFILEVRVENTSEHAYGWRLEAVQLEDGRSVQNGGEKWIDPGTTTSVRGRWELPRGSTPKGFRVRIVRYAEDGDRTSADTKQVPLGKVAVQRK